MFLHAPVVEMATSSVNGSGMKRDRDSVEWGREDEPLTKRINNLHLDSHDPAFQRQQQIKQHMQQQQQQQHLLAGLPSQNLANCHQMLQPSQSQLIQLPQQHLQFPQQHLQIPQQHLQLPQQHLQIPQQHLQQQMNCQQQQINNQREQELLLCHDRLQTLIASRELPESINIMYDISSTENPHYFSCNKILHDLHIERLKRMGKIN